MIRSMALVVFPMADTTTTIFIPTKLAALKADDIPEVARAAMIEAHRDYPVPKNMSLAEAEQLLQQCLS